MDRVSEWNQGWTANRGSWVHRLQARWFNRASAVAVQAGSSHSLLVSRTGKRDAEQERRDGREEQNGVFAVSKERLSVCVTREGWEKEVQTEVSSFCRRRRSTRFHSTRVHSFEARKVKLERGKGGNEKRERERESWIEKSCSYPITFSVRFKKDAASCENLSRVLVESLHQAPTLTKLQHGHRNTRETRCKDRRVRREKDVEPSADPTKDIVLLCRRLFSALCRPI